MILKNIGITENFQTKAPHNLSEKESLRIGELTVTEKLQEPFFADRITRNALYILDEPENSLSVQSQMVLYDFLLEAVRFYNCQLIIATHSPFLLALPDAKIYDFDAHPMTTRSWEKLKGVKTVFNFFWDRREQFVTGSKSAVNGENNE